MMHLITKKAKPQTQCLSLTADIPNIVQTASFPYIKEINITPNYSNGLPAVERYRWEIISGNATVNGKKEFTGNIKKKTN